MDTDDAVQNYINVSKALQTKYDEIKRGVITRRQILSEDFKPIVKPLREISKKLSKNETANEEERTDPNLLQKYLHLHQTGKPDFKFGIHVKNGDYYVGHTPLKIQGNNLHFDGGMKFVGTPGLWELLTLQQPVNYTEEDLNNYEQIVLRTDTYRHNNNPRAERIKSSGGFKYKNIIQPILIKNDILKGCQQQQQQQQTLEDFVPPDENLDETFDEALDKTLDETLKEGSGLQKILTNTPVEYVYWNTLDELLERLYIVYGEMKAGYNMCVRECVG